MRICPTRALPACLSASLAACLAACGTVDVGRMPAAPAFPAPVTASALPPYRIQVGDVLSVRVPLSPELDEDVPVRPDGRISTTLVTEAPAAGLTVDDLTAALERDYARTLTAPHLSVIVKESRPFRVFMAGAVMHPGAIGSADGSLTLTQAIAEAGGVKLAGDATRVFILRRGADGAGHFLSTRYADVADGTDPAADVVLATDDVVIVPRTSIAIGYQYFNQYLQQFVPVSWGFSYVLNQGLGGTTVTQPGAVSSGGSSTLVP